MKENLSDTKGLYNSQRLLLKLIEKGLTREDAYGIVQKIAIKSWNEELDFKNLLKKNNQIKKVMNAKEIDKIFDLNYHFKNVSRIFKKLIDND